MLLLHYESTLYYKIRVCQSFDCEILNRYTIKSLMRFRDNVNL